MRVYGHTMYTDLYIIRKRDPVIMCVLYVQLSVLVDSLCESTGAGGQVSINLYQHVR